MEIDPLELAEKKEEKKEKAEESLGTFVALVVALLATFMAICEVKGNNLEQEMQRAQIEKNDTWAWYQARNVRQEVLDTAARQLKVIASTLEGPKKASVEAEADKHEKLAVAQRSKMEDLEKKAKEIETEYARLNGRDDQLDLEAASLSIAVSLLAVTVLTRKRWLLYVAAVPILLGVVMGLAGLLGLPVPTSFG